MAGRIEEFKVDVGWVVKGIIAWLGPRRRLAEDYENLSRSAVAFIRLASIRLLLRRLTRPCSAN